MLLSEMFGVELDAPFMVEGYESGVLFRVRLSESGTEYLQVDFGEGDGWEYSSGITWAIVIHLAPAGIIRLPPPLTDEQRTGLMALHTMGARYMGMDPDGWKRCFVNKPIKTVNIWMSREITDKQTLRIAPRMANCLDSLVSWSDPEPFDIDKALGIKR